VVAAYTDEFDCVAMLRFPQDLVQEHGLVLGMRLLTVNTYSKGTELVADLEHGPASYRRFSNFGPYIADFLSDDRERIEARKAQIPEAEWKRTAELSAAKLAKCGSRFRNGNPVKSFEPAR